MHNTYHARRLFAVLAVLGLIATALPAAAAAAEGVVNVNTASLDELTLLPRVGPVVAQRIVDFREANGELSEPEDLMLVRGIGEKTFELLEPYVVLTGETTLSEKVRASRAGQAGDE